MLSPIAVHSLTVAVYLLKCVAHFLLDININYQAREGGKGEQQNMPCHNSICCV
jgi:hypothetical protein